MSYARKGEDGSDVYVYYSGNYVCQGCRIWPRQELRRERLLYTWCCEQPADMLAHLMLHRERGHHVPERAIQRLQGDVEAGGYRGP